MVFQKPLSLCLKTSGRCLKQNNMAYRVLDLVVPEHDIMVQEHWYKQKSLTKKEAMLWFQEQLEQHEITVVPEKYLLRVLTFTQGGSLCRNLTKDIVRTID